MTLLILGIVLAVVACVMCTSQALIKWIEGEDMNWTLLLLGILNGFILVIDLCILITALQNE